MSFVTSITPIDTSRKSSSSMSLEDKRRLEQMQEEMYTPRRKTDDELRWEQLSRHQSEMIRHHYNEDNYYYSGISMGYNVDPGEYD